MGLDTKALLGMAAQGDQAAWDILVRLHTGLLWSIARSFRLDAADAADVVQMTWLRLVESIDRIKEPDRLAAWLATVARRECVHLLRRSGREHRANGLPDPLFDPPDAGPPVDDKLLRRERDVALWEALTRLTEKCQRLLRVLMSDPPPAYTEVAAALDMPVGSIGPSRQRCLEQLRKVVMADPVLGAPQPRGERP